MNSDCSFNPDNFVIPVNSTLTRDITRNISAFIVNIIDNQYLIIKNPLSNEGDF